MVCVCVCVHERDDGDGTLLHKNNDLVQTGLCTQSGLRFAMKKMYNIVRLSSTDRQPG